MIPERFLTCKMKLALVIVSSLLCQSTADAELEEIGACSSQPSSSAESDLFKCGPTVVLDDHGDEGLSLVQVGAKRVQRAAAAAAAAAAPAETTAETPVTAAKLAETSKKSANAVAALAMMETAMNVKAGVSEVVMHGVHALSDRLQTRTGISPTLSIVIVAVVGIVALSLLVVAMQPGSTTRDNLANPSISQNFPRAHTGPYSRQQGAPGPSYSSSPDPSKMPGYNPYGSNNYGDARPSMYERPSLPSQQQPGSRYSSLPAGQQHSGNFDRDGRPLPRVSTTASNNRSPKPSVLPRVQAPGSRPVSRPGTGLGLTPAHSITPQKQTEEAYGNAMASEVPPPEVTGFAPRRPPPLCPMLVLPHCESFFAVPIDQLVAGMSTVEILGLSGNALLRSTVKDTSEGRVIEVSMSPPRSPPLASISEPLDYGPRAGMKELKGSRGKHYGWLRPGNNGYVLRCGEDDVMTVVTNAGSGQCQLYAGSNGDMLAQASRSGDGEGIFAAEDLEVRVTPGMDAVLALLCVVSAVLFGQGPSSFQFPPSRPSAMA